MVFSSGFRSPLPAAPAEGGPKEVVITPLLRCPNGDPIGGTGGPQLGGPPTDFGVVGPSLLSTSMAGVSGPLLMGCGYGLLRLAGSPGVLAD